MVAQTDTIQFFFLLFSLFWCRAFLVYLKALRQSLQLVVLLVLNDRKYVFSLLLLFWFDALTTLRKTKSITNPTEQPTYLIDVICEKTTDKNCIWRIKKVKMKILLRVLFSYYRFSSISRRRHIVFVACFFRCFVFISFPWCSLFAPVKGKNFAHTQTHYKPNFRHLIRLQALYFSNSD